MNVPSMDQHDEHSREIAALWEELRLTQQMMPRLLTFSQTCEAIGIGQSTLSALIKQGKLEPVYVGTKPMFPPDTVRTYIQSKRISSGRAGEMVVSVLSDGLRS